LAKGAAAVVLRTQKPTERKTKMSKKKGNLPTHLAYVVDEYAKGKKFWNRVGSVWLHEDGEGMTVALIPNLSVYGQIVIRTVKELEETDSE
jgi:hypothetical protein